MYAHIAQPMPTCRSHAQDDQGAPDASVHDVAGLLMKYLRSLPEVWGNLEPRTCRRLGRPHGHGH
jgi:hypothetical protein